MTPIMIKLRRSVSRGGLLAVIVALLLTSLGFVPAHASPQVVQPSTSIASVQAVAQVVTPERVMIPKDWSPATLYANPYVADQWGGKWGGTCRYDSQYIGLGKYRYHEVRQNNYYGKRCTRTGYYVESSSLHVNVIWYYVPWWHYIQL